MATGRAPWRCHPLAAWPARCHKGAQPKSCRLWRFGCLIGGMSKPVSQRHWIWGEAYAGDVVRSYAVGCAKVANGCRGPSSALLDGRHVCCYRHGCPSRARKKSQGAQTVFDASAKASLRGSTSEATRADRPTAAGLTVTLHREPRSRPLVHALEHALNVQHAIGEAFAHQLVRNEVVVLVEVGRLVGIQQLHGVERS